jgi:GxxExxY protein
MIKEYQYQELTHDIINAAYTVHNALGTGFLEKVYHNALAVELKLNGHIVECEKPLTVKYRNEIVGEYYADIFVDGSVIVEVKATEKNNPAYEAQVLNYLKATKSKVGLLINFGASVSVKRLVM